MPDHEAIAPPAVGLAFRTDIAGLRAVAVGMVVLYHAGVPWLPGGYVGVDVFFVVSGFLMTALVTREIERTGTVDLSAFYARRIRRLLPAAMVVLVATVTAAKLLLPPLALPDISAAAISTGLYVSNVWLAVRGTDYLASEDPAPLQHYWSLAVEEQFYLVWPILLLLAYVVARRYRLPVARSVALVCAASFALCVWVTSVSQPWAFFSLPTRAWELGVGGLVALAAPRLQRLPARVGRAMGRLGLAALAVTAVTYTEFTPFPGWTAAVPVAATATLIAGGTGGGQVALLGRAPMQLVGRLSYSLYLWHWPLLVLPVAAYGELGPWTRAGLVVAGLVLARVTHDLVEQPVHHAPRMRRQRRSYAVAACLTVAGVLAGLGAGEHGRLSTDLQVDPLTAVRVALTMPGPAEDVPANVTPALADVDDDVPSIYGDCHGDFFDVIPPGCVFGKADSDRSVFLLGDSHAAQWFPALQRAAVQEGWRLTVVTKNACPAFAIEVINRRLGRSYDECEQWRANALARMHAERPDVVIIGNYSASYRDLAESDEGFLTAWSEGVTRLVGELPAGTRAVVLGDSPTWPVAPANCLSAHVDDPEACSAPVADLVDEPIVADESAAAATAGATYVPITPWLCGQRCQAMAANVVVYRDRHHVTATFAALLDDHFVEVLRSASDPAR